MQAHGVRTVAAVTALTMLVGVAAIAGNEPVRRFAPEPPKPTRDELVDIGVITSDFPVPGALPPEVYPRELWGLDTGPDLTWLLVVMTAVGRRRAARRRRRARAATSAMAPEMASPEVEVYATRAQRRTAADGARRGRAIARGCRGRAAGARCRAGTAARIRPTRARR